MGFRKQLIKIGDFVKAAREKLSLLLNRLLLFLSVFTFLVIIFDFGFAHTAESLMLIESYYDLIIIIFFSGYLLRTLVIRGSFLKNRRRLAEFALTVILFFTLVTRILYTDWILDNFPNLYHLRSSHGNFIILLLVFFIEVSKVSFHVYTRSFNPSLVFIGSFLLIILFGSGLLMLPNSTVSGISFIDALFTSTSAVCVTGLAVVDTATYYTFMGKTIILVLIQIGALGIMTFTSFFGFFFQGGFSFQQQLAMKDFLNDENIGNIFKTLVKVISITLGIEAVGAVLIYYSLGNVSSITDSIFFSIFHSVSAFSNAGFSTLSDGLYDPGIRANYNLHLIIAALVILGGLGFPIVFNYYRYIKKTVVSDFNRLLRKEKFYHTPRIVNINTKIALITTFVLLVSGTILYFLTEHNNTLKDLSWYGKFVTSVFGSVTTRTAGFNTVDMTTLTAPTVLIFLLFMWIGASPGSTGGGIKTTTFAVALMNMISFARGKDRIEVFKREVSAESVKRAFSIMILSLLVIGLAVFLITLFDPQLDLQHVAFECFSAYATVGLSLGITAKLSAASKIVLTITMFLGRVGTLTLLVGLIYKVKSLSYRYPTENIICN